MVNASGTLRPWLLVGLMLGVLAPLPQGGSSATRAEERALMLAATTSTENSGLLGHVLPRFEAATGIPVRVVTAGTGAVLKLAERGDVDVVLVHSRTDEVAFLANGFGIDRRAVMANDFVIAGPADDPAGVAGLTSATEALARIALHQALFLSRGDDSGTDKAERRLWSALGRDPDRFGAWYRQSGAGQGATLNIATNLGAYLLTDRATWASFRNRGDLRLLVAGDPELYNPYSVIRVDPARFPDLAAAAALSFVDWLTSAPGRAAIESFRIDGERVFFVTTDAERPSG